MKPLTPELKKAFIERLSFYRDLGIYDFYQRPVTVLQDAELDPEMARAKNLPRASAEADSVGLGSRRLHPMPPAQAGTQADRLRRRKPSRGCDVYR